MKVKVPYFYSATAIKKRHTNPKEYVFYSNETVDLKEVSLKDTRLVAKVKLKAESDMPEQTIEYRSLNGKIIKPLTIDLRERQNYYNRNQTEIEKIGKMFYTRVPAEILQGLFDQMQTGLTARYSYFNRATPNFFTAQPKYFVGAAMSDSQDEVREILNSSKDQTLAELREAVRDNCAIVDGIVYTKSNGPGYHVDVQPWYNFREQVEQRGNDRQDVIVLKIIEDCLQHSIKEKRVFGVDQMPQMLSCIERIKRQKQIQTDAIQVNDIEILNLDAFTYRDKFSELLTAAGETIKTMQTELFNLNPDAIEQFARLKRNYLLSSQTNNPDTFDNLLGELKAMHEFRLQHYNDRMPQDKKAPMIKLEQFLEKNPTSDDDLFLSAEDVSEIFAKP